MFLAILKCKCCAQILPKGEVPRGMPHESFTEGIFLHVIRPDFFVPCFEMIIVREP